MIITTQQQVVLTGYGVDGAGTPIPASAPVWSTNNAHVVLNVVPGDPAQVVVTGATVGTSTITLTDGMLTTTFSVQVVAPTEASVGIVAGLPGPSLTSPLGLPGRGRAYGIGGL